MLYLFGYIVACFLVVSGLSWGFATLYRSSTFKPPDREKRVPPLIRSHALVSFSVILPFSALGFLFLTLAVSKIAKLQIQEGHTSLVIGALFLPALCFLLGFFYFKKVVGS